VACQRFKLELEQPSAPMIPELPEMDWPDKNGIVHNGNIKHIDVDLHISITEDTEKAEEMREDTDIPPTMTDVQAASVSGYLDTWYKLSERMWNQKSGQESIYGHLTDDQKSDVPIKIQEECPSSPSSGSEAEQVTDYTREPKYANLMKKPDGNDLQSSNYGSRLDLARHQSDNYPEERTLQDMTPSLLSAPFANSETSLNSSQTITGSKEAFMNSMLSSETLERPLSPEPADNPSPTVVIREDANTRRREERPPSFIRNDSYLDAQQNGKKMVSAQSQPQPPVNEEPVQFRVGDRIIDTKDNLRATVLFVGEVPPTKGEWIGVDWDAGDVRGKHDGTHNGKRYFTAKCPKSGSFVRPVRVQLITEDEFRFSNLDENLDIASMRVHRSEDSLDTESLVKASIAQRSRSRDSLLSSKKSSIKSFSLSRKGKSTESLLSSGSNKSGSSKGMSSIFRKKGKMSAAKSSESVLSDDGSETASSSHQRAKSVEFLDDLDQTAKKVKSKFGSLLRSKSVKTKNKDDWKA